MSMKQNGSSQFKAVCVSESATILLMIQIVAPCLVILIILFFYHNLELHITCPIVHAITTKFYEMLRLY